MWLIKAADIFFVIFHTSLIIFILFGWIWKRTRFWNLVVLLLTGGSWTILGIFYGFGYCPLTDWHFRILERLGHTGLPSSYIKYLADRITGLSFNSELVDSVTLWGLIVALVISLYLNIRSLIGRLKLKKE
ncbi:MAG: hypothetical protein AMS27_08155 [Bacteroides sp. SM23_62_1]|nr:MAG: hypothetical protein AMS27_08155 [Bacteroides sp. SM23_62_1]